ncbi:MAG TPA: hypothetical protein VFH88_06110 [Candidatus Krumholzibacteria bacterium]|nr:hypothetical protein [Candidatus Krumholzibacteria bacterium]
MRAINTLVAAAALALVVPGCGGKDVGTQPESPPAKPAFQDLTRPEHVLSNFEASYNKRYIEKYDELLDDNFTFVLDTGDVLNGLPASWDRATEVLMSTRMFDRNYTGGHLVKNISMDLTIDHVTWVDVQPDQNQYPGETWLSTVVYYAFRAEALPDDTYETSAGTRAQFTVRNAGTNDTPAWRLVELKDLGTGSTPSLSASISSPDEFTLGRIKWELSQ